MISVAEIRRRAADEATGEARIERDYLLSWVLRSLYETDLLKRSFVFKGGTALRKLYFPRTRFSVDLDFTLVDRIAESRLRSGLLDVGVQVEAECGLEFLSPRFRLEKIQDEYGAETFQIIHSVWESTLSGLTAAYPPFEDAWDLIGELVAIIS